MVAAMNESLNGWARSHPIWGAVVLVIRTILVAVGLGLMAISVPLALVTPIFPVGLPVGLLGLVLVAAASKTAHRWITNRLRKHPWIWRRVRFAFGEKGSAE
jgi:hypothetical protein